MLVQCIKVTQRLKFSENNSTNIASFTNPLLEQFCRTARSCQSFSASHIDQRDLSAFHRPLYKRPGSNMKLGHAVWRESLVCDLFMLEQWPCSWHFMNNRIFNLVFYSLYFIFTLDGCTCILRYGREFVVSGYCSSRLYNTLVLVFLHRFIWWTYRYDMMKTLALTSHPV